MEAKVNSYFIVTYELRSNILNALLPCLLTSFDISLLISIISYRKLYIAYSSTGLLVGHTSF
jgi:hypothetical protein